MSNMQTTILVIHTLIALAIIALVLIQRGKGADAGAAFGAGASGTVFGARGASSFFSRATAILATAFFATSLTLAYISSQRTGAPESIIENVPAESGQVLPGEESVDVVVDALPSLDSDVPEADDSSMPSLDADPERDAAADEAGDSPPAGQ